MRPPAATAPHRSSGVTVSTVTVSSATAAIDSARATKATAATRLARSSAGQSNGGQSSAGQNGGQNGGQGNSGSDDEFGGNRARRGRFRERNRGRGSNPSRDRFGQQGEPDPVITDDDVLVPVAGIVDILDNYAFVRTGGYLSGPDDVYVSLSQVRRNGLRKGDAVTGAVRQPREGERREKFNALVRLDTVNGVDPEEAKKRPDFAKLTPLYPQERLRLETEPGILTTRVIDLVAPIGKGQRGLIVSPPKAGKTMVLQAIANAITTNNPETPPDGRARRRAPGRGHRHAALGEG